MLLRLLARAASAAAQVRRHPAASRAMAHTTDPHAVWCIYHLLKILTVVMQLISACLLRRRRLWCRCSWRRPAW